jgi:Flp pilus assembly protein CpaB
VKRSNRLLILIGVFLAAFAFVGVVLIANNAGLGGGATAAPTPTPEPKTTVVVAKQDIHLGDKITADMVTAKQVTVSEKLALGTDTFTSTNEVIGKIAGGSIAKDEVLHSGTDFLPAGTMAEGQSITSGIASGMDAVAIEVDQVNGVGTLIVGGDHVDVILATQVSMIGLTNMKTAGKNSLTLTSGTDVTSKLIIENRKVLATLLPPPETTTGAAGLQTQAAPQGTSATISNNGRHMIVILEVTPAEAEVIRYAQRLEASGDQSYVTLGLALRSDKDNDSTTKWNTGGITFARLVQLYGVLPPDPRGFIPQDIRNGIQW